jgi:uncharacterized protein (DUF58 family)
MSALRLPQFSAGAFFRSWFRPRPVPAALPCTLERKRIYILPTPLGLVFIGVLTGMLVGSINYNNNIAFLLTFLLGSMTVVSILHTHRNLLGVRVRSVTPSPAFATEPAVFRVVVRAPAPTRRAISFRFPDGEEAPADLGADRDEAIAVTAPTSARGRFHPGPLRISTVFPLGLFRAWSRMDLELETVVYPRPLQGPFATGTGGEAAVGDGEAAAGAGADDFDGLKSYQPGDALQHISWKAFSKGQGLQTKVFVGEAGVTVMLDWDAVREPDLERRLSRLCGQVLRANNRDLYFGLRLPGLEIPPDRGETHKHACLRALALFGTGGDPQ